MTDSWIGQVLQIPKDILTNSHNKGISRNLNVDFYEE